ncbi:MAG: PorV/PorQ family protein [bacterium]
MRSRTVLVFVLMIAILSNAWAAKIFEKVGTFGAQFLKIGAGARGVAMGEAFVAMDGDATCTYWNPAGIANIPGSQIALAHATWPAEMSHEFASYVFSYKFIPGVIGLSALVLQMDPMPETTEYAPSGTGYSFDAGSMAFGLTYARMLTDRFLVGATVKWIHEGLGDYSGETFAIDMGTIYDTGFRGIKIGMAFLNMGPGYTFYENGKESPMPIMFKVGSSMPLINNGDHRMMGAVEFNHPPDGAERMNVGAEYVFQRFGPEFEVAFRGGYRLNRDEEGFTAGFGVKFPFVRIGLLGKPSVWTVDYCYSDMGLIEASHKISLSASY